MKLENKSKAYVYLGVLAAVLLTESALSQSSFSLEVIARTGGTTPAGNTITALGTGPSINDAGRVAYVVTIQDGRQGVLVSGESSSRSSLIEDFNVDAFTRISGLSSNFSFPNEVQINNQDQIAWRVSSRDGLFAFIFRLGTTSSDFRIIAKTYYDNVSTPDVDLPSPFVGPFPSPSSGLKPWVSLNNSGRSVFSGVLAPSAVATILATPRNPETSGHNASSDYHLSGGQTGYPNLFPVVSDGDYTLVRAGGSTTDSLILFSDATLASAWTIAAGPNFTSIGEKPGISDDNYVITFFGVRASTGAGIYGEATAGVFKITGGGGQFSALFPSTRVGVNLSGDGNPNSYTVAFLANRATGGPPASDPLGLYTVRVDVTNPGSPVISPPKLVVETGNTIDGLPGQVTNIAFYDPINSHGQLAFWVGTMSGAAIIRATVSPIILVHGWHGGAANWDLIKSYLEMDGYSVHVLDYDDTLAPPQAAAALNDEVASVLGSAGTTKVNLITHSYGGLVARHFIEELGQGNRVKNLIMIAPPNHGSRLADYLVGTLVEQPQATIVEYLLDFYSTLFRADRTWGSSLAMRTLQNDYLDTLNLLFGSRLPSLTSRYFIIAGTEPYPAKFTSHSAFLAGPDDGAVAARSARLSGVPLYCVTLNHSAIVNPRLVREWDSPPGVPENTPALDQALDKVLAMYTGVIRPILEGTPPATDSGCADAQDVNDDQPLLDILTRISVGVQKDDVVQRTFEVADDTGAVTVTFTHRFSEFEFCLRMPSGEIICATNIQQFDGVSFIETTNAMSYTIHSPEEGQWQLMIRVIDVPDQGEDLNIYVLSQASSDRPRLWVDRSDAQITLSWTTSFNGFLVESRDSLSPPSMWSSITNAPVDVGNRWVVSLPLANTNSAVFYRLRKQ